MVSLPEPITNPQTRDPYLASSLMEEAITSSKLEGAVTTRAVAREMIRSGRKPRDNSERMILDNDLTMQRIRALKASALSPQKVFEIHRLVTEKSLEDPTAAGRFRSPDEKRVVGDDLGEVYHTPPPAEELVEGKSSGEVAFVWRLREPIRRLNPAIPDKALESCPVSWPPERPVGAVPTWGRCVAREVERLARFGRFRARVSCLMSA